MKLLKDRYNAGVLLANALKKSVFTNAVILTLPRGGAPIAHELSCSLHLPWDVLLVKKIVSPEQPEFAIGAISEDHQPIWNNDSIAMLGLREEELRALAEAADLLVLQKLNKWRKGRKSPDVKGRTVILTDDGLATGLTMLSAIQYLKKREVAKIIVAVPVASRSAVELIRGMVDEVIALYTPEPFYSVGQWYEDFTQVTDETVTELLNR